MIIDPKVKSDEFSINQIELFRFKFLSACQNVSFQKFFILFFMTFFDWEKA